MLPLEIGILLPNLDMMLFLEYPDLDMFFLEIFLCFGLPGGPGPTRTLSESP